MTTRKDHENDPLEILRHDAAHILAQAVQELFSDVKVAIGPVIENGFYYDFSSNQPFTLEDLTKIESRMHDIVDRCLPIKKEIWTKKQAIDFFSANNEKYKVEIISSLPTSEDLTIYRQGDTWLDLCKGPHNLFTKGVGHAFKLTKISASHWRGQKSGDPLQRIYGTAWLTQEDLTNYLHQIEEAEKRDHRKIGKALDLFHLQEEAQGSVFWHPKGFIIWQELEQYIRRRVISSGYLEVKTPQLSTIKFWRTSGHWSKFRDNMFIVPDVILPLEEKDEKDDNLLKTIATHNTDWMALKPMNCPAHIQIFKQGIKSYRDLPLRLFEFGCCHRNEPHGALHGLMRVRQMTQDDAHIFCTTDHIFVETIRFYELLRLIYHDLGFDSVSVRLATRPSIYAGKEDLWDLAEDKLEKSIQQAKVDYELAPGEGAFYGPKLEFHLKDSIGRSWQCGTLQLDFVLPERFKATYVGEDGCSHTPVMLHRVILGSMERFLGIMLEHYEGKVPMWMAPTQAVVATITSDATCIQYANYVVSVIKKHNNNIRIVADIRQEKITYKLREHMANKIPMVIIVGKKELEGKFVSLRCLGSKEQKIVSLDSCVDMLREKCKSPDFSDSHEDNANTSAQR